MNISTIPRPGDEVKTVPLSKALEIADLEYRENNKERLREQQKEYRENNKERLREQRSAKQEVTA